MAKEKSYIVCKAVPADKESCLVNIQGKNVDHGAVGQLLMDYICQDDGLTQDMVVSKRDELKCKNYLQEQQDSRAACLQKAQPTLLP